MISHLLAVVLLVLIMYKSIASLQYTGRVNFNLRSPFARVARLASVSTDRTVSPTGKPPVSSLPYTGASANLHPSTATTDANAVTDLDTIYRNVESPGMQVRSVKQPYDAFLVLDVEATCFPGSDFNWPNEIIEWPVCLLRWTDKNANGEASDLEIIDEFRSFVKPTWRPVLSEFCTSLTGITQNDIEPAPDFPNVLDSFSEFLARNGLIDKLTGERLQRFAWCTDGPFDIRDFVVKQCFISKIPMPEWLKRDVMNVRRVVEKWLLEDAGISNSKSPQLVPKRLPLNIPRQLQALGLPAFEGREHSGIDDARNIARILMELARVGVRLEPNLHIRPNKRWQWMGQPGEVLEEYCTT